MCPRIVLAACWLALSALLPVSAVAAPFAYITNADSDNVSVIDTATDTVVATIPVGAGPTGVAVNAAGTRVYVSNTGSGNVSVINTATHTVTATVPVGVGPIGVAVNPAGTRVYVANLFSQSLSVIDTTTNAIVANVAMGTFVLGVAVNPAGTRVYITTPAADSTKLLVLDTASNTIVDTLVVGMSPQGVTVNPAGTRVYVTSDQNSTVSVIDAATHRIVTNVWTEENPTLVAVNPAGTRAYVTNFGADSVLVFDTATNIFVAKIEVGAAPVGIAVNPAGTKVYVANSGSNNVSVIDTATNMVIATIPVGVTPAAFGQFITPAVAPPAAPSTATAVEYYNPSLDHYFLTHMANEIAILDAGVVIKGWARTGQSFAVYTTASAGTSSVCRFYIPPGHGDSHFYGRDTVECDATGRNNPSFINEDPHFFHVVLPTAGVCPAGTREIYRVFSNRPDVNHRYMIDSAIRDRMVSLSWLAEGAGPNLVVMCGPA